MTAFSRNRPPPFSSSRAEWSRRRSPSLLLRRRTFFLPVDTDAELRLLSCALDVNGHLRPHSVLFEKAVGGFQQQSLPSAQHLRDGSLQLCGSCKVQRPALQAVLAFE